MKQNYIKLHDQGLSPSEIANKYQLDVSTVYGYLGEIAKANGVSRDSLLEQPHSEHITHERRFAPVKPVDPTEICERFDVLAKEVKSVNQTIAKEVRRQENLLEKVQREEEGWK